MKVLWFSNSPGFAEEILTPGSFGGGWLKALDIEVQEKVDLHIAFYHTRAKESFVYNKTTYHPIYTKYWKWNAIMGLFNRHIIDDEDINIYLRIINKVKPDIIHIHGTENPFGCLISKSGIPIVLSIQGNISACLQKYSIGLERKYLKVHSSIFSRGIKYRLLEESFARQRKLFIKMKSRELKSLRNCINIIGRTAWDSRISSVLAPERRYFHCDEILRNSFYSNQWTPSEDTNHIIIHTTSSRNNPFKGFETICESLYELQNTGVTNIEWRVAGIEESDLIVLAVKKKLKNKFPKEGLILLGGLSEINLIQKLKEADIYIMPSHMENSPNNLCEAMMLGMPCIATFAGGTGSIMKDGEEGILVQDGDPWAMAGAILEYQRDRDKGIRFGVNARNRALARHDRDSNVTALINIYKEIISHSGLK
jgi:glycosyltransferase involved in cell wall biosynthesis